MHRAQDGRGRSPRQRTTACAQRKGGAETGTTGYPVGDDQGLGDKRAITRTGRRLWGGAGSLSQTIGRKSSLLLRTQYSDGTRKQITWGKWVSEPLHTRRRNAGRHGIPCRSII